MLRRTNFGMLVDDLGTSSEDEKALADVIRIAKSVGMEVIENKTAISVKFALEIMKRLVSSGTAERIHLLNHIENLEERIKRIEQEPCEDAISRQAAIEETLKYTMTSGVTNQGTWNECVHTIADTLANAECLPSVQPKVVPIAETRFDDKLHEIVDEAVKNIEIKYEWIPIKTRPLTEKEKAEMGTESDYMYDCPLPDDGEEVEVTTHLGDVAMDIFCRESGGCYFENYCDDGDVLAWRHKPEPYKAESEDNNDNPRENQESR